MRSSVLLLVVALLPCGGLFAQAAPAAPTVAPTAAASTKAPPEAVTPDTALPDLEALRALQNEDPRRARNVLRRAARTAPDPERRSVGLQLLSRRDPTRATARICARALRIDPAPAVRRAAAECLGRLPASITVLHTVDLIGALADDNLDVVTMAGWALANAGDTSSLAPLSALLEHEDDRVARIFYGYVTRTRTRLGLRATAPRVAAGSDRLVPPATALMNTDNNLEPTLAGGWLALYGGMTGWLHGTTFPGAFGGPGFQSSIALTTLAGTVVGIAGGGAYGILRVKRLAPAHAVVQLGTFGTLAGYGTGILSALPPKRGLNMASFSLVGTLAGTTAGVVLIETAEPTPGALALGMSAGLGAGVTFSGLALGYGFDGTGALGLGMLAGGLGGAMTTLAAAPYEFGLIHPLGTAVGGVTGAAVGGMIVGFVDVAQLGAQPILFTEGAGWAIAGGYAVGAATGFALAFLVPPSLDPFLGDAPIQIKAPTITALPDLRDPTRTTPLAVVEGTF